MTIYTWPDEKAKKYDLSSFKYTYNIGITIPPFVYNKLRERWGITSGVGIASCEYPWVTVITPRTMSMFLDQNDKRVASMGYPALNTLVKIVDSKGEEVSRGDIGELAVRHPAMAVGYLRQTDRTKELIREGWIYTGNMVSEDEDGYIYLEGKKEDLGMFPVDKEGKYVMPYKIQEAVNNIPEVVEAALISMPDPEYQAIYRVVVRLKEGVMLSKEKVREVVLRYAPDYLIEDVIFRDKELPKTPSGKIVVRALAQEYGGVIPEE